MNWAHMNAQKVNVWVCLKMGMEGGADGITKERESGGFVTNQGERELPIGVIAERENGVLGSNANHERGESEMGLE